MFTAELRKRNINSWKLAGVFNRGFPDRVLIGPGTRMAFVELKSADGKLTLRQKLVISILRAANVPAYVLHGGVDRATTRSLIETFVEAYMKTVLYHPSYTPL